ncbi:MAG: response regulator [Fibrobacterales bacterium]
MNSDISKRYNSLRLSNQLRQSSDNLTKIVRMYAVSGDKKYQRFFNEILDIRDGKRERPSEYHDIYWDFRLVEEPDDTITTGSASSLISLMEKQGFSRGELKLLAKSKVLSDRLVKLETIAINAIEGRFLDQKGLFTVIKSPDRELALEILFSDEYLKAKKEIMLPIKSFMMQVDERTSQTLKKNELVLHAIEKRLNQCVIVLLLIIVAFAVTVYYYRGIVLSEESALLNTYKFLIEQPNQMAFTLDILTDSLSFTGDVEGVIGYSEPEFTNVPVEKWRSLQHPDDQERLTEIVENLYATGENYQNQYRVQVKNGEYKHIDVSGYFIRDKESKVCKTIGLVKDIDNLKQIEIEKISLQEKLNHRNKMDAIGQLTGGIAHDFNNSLAGIMGAAEVMSSRGESMDEKNRAMVDMIIKACSRAADLTTKLLSFGRKGKVLSSAISLHEVIDETADILRRTLDKKIEVRVSKGADYDSVIGDGSELHGALMNLCINAGHAITNNGFIDIETSNVELKQKYCNSSSFDIMPGKYIEVEVRDSGCGIPFNELCKVFEPFYTTKKENEGTGLGLAAVYGTIEDHKGSINVYSEEGVGTSFQILIPCTEDESIVEVQEKKVINGNGTILLVDDEEIIRVTGKTLLKTMGYTVLLAENGERALDIIRNSESAIDLVITDMIMPKMSGSDLFIKLKAEYPRINVIISSGFVKDERITPLVEQGLNGFIRKPFRDYELSELVSSILENNNKT